MFREKRLQFVEPSEPVMQAYIDKSESHLHSGKILIDQGKFDEPIEMAYFSMYYMVLALLFRVGIKSKNHSASIILMDVVFDIDDDDLWKAKDEREDKQYFIDPNISREDAEEMMRLAERFNSEMHDTLERLNSERVSDHRSRLKELLGRT